MADFITFSRAAAAFVRESTLASSPGPVSGRSTLRVSDKRVPMLGGRETEDGTYCLTESGDGEERTGDACYHLHSRPLHALESSGTKWQDASGKCSPGNGAEVSLCATWYSSSQRLWIRLLFFRAAS